MYTNYHKKSHEYSNLSSNKHEVKENSNFLYHLYYIDIRYINGEYVQHLSIPAWSSAGAASGRAVGKVPADNPRNTLSRIKRIYIAFIKYSQFSETRDRRIKKPDLQLKKDSAL